MLLRRASARCVSPALCLARLTSAAAAGRLIMNSLSQVAVEPAREGMASEVSHSSLRRLAQHNKTVLFALSARILRGSLIRRAAEDLWIDTSFGRTF